MNDEFTTPLEEVNPQKTKKRTNFGVFAVAFGLLSIIGLGVFFLPLAIICSIFALIKKDYIYGGLGALGSVFALVMNPSIIAFYAFLITGELPEHIENMQTHQSEVTQPDNQAQQTGQKEE